MRADTEPSVTYGTRAGSKGAAQLQLRDLEATLGPYREQVKQLDAELAEALIDTQQSAS